MRIITRCSVLAVLLIVGPVADAMAQLAFPVRPTSNRLFGPRRSDPNRRSLGLSGSLHGGFDSDVLAGLTDQTLATGPNTQSGSIYGGGVGLTFRQPGPVRVNASAQTGRSFSPAVSGANAPWHAVRGNVDSDFALSRRLGIQVSGQFGYVSQTDPSSQVFESFDTVALPSLGRELLGVELSTQGVIQEQGQAGISYETSRRGTLLADYTISQSDFVGYEQGFREQTGGVSYRHEVGRHMSARFEYRYGRFRHQFHTGQVATFPESNIIATVDYSRDLTPNMSRQTILSLRTGTSVVAREPLENRSDRSDRLTFLTANAGLRHELGRSWFSQIGYSRDLRFLDGFGSGLASERVCQGSDLSPFQRPK